MPAKFTDEQLAAWVPKNYCPPEWGDQSAREAGIASRVMAVIKSVREQYESEGLRPKPLSSKAVRKFAAGESAERRAAS